MKKLKKIISVIAVASVAISSLYVGIYAIYVQAHKNEAAMYLVEKYGFEIQDIFLLDYKPSKFHDDTDLGIPFDWYRTDETWKFKYNGRIFGVSKSEYGLSDDYQLEDVFVWSVDYLKAIDSNIVGITIDYGKLQEIIIQEEIEEFLTSVNDSFIVYYKVDKLTDYYATDHNEFKFANNNFKILNSRIMNKYSFINENIENKGIVLTNSNIEFSRNKHDNFASYYYDTKISRDALSKKGMII